MDNFSVRHVSPPIRARKNSRPHKVLANPYQGCAHQCLFCPANNGFLARRVFDEFRQNGIISVIDNIVDHIDAHVSDNPNAKTLHLSPVTDPFQPLESTYQLSQRVLEYAVEHNLALAVCTKGVVPDAAQALLQQHPDSFVQVSILTPNQDKFAFLVRGYSASVEDLYATIRAMTSRGIFVIARIDPIYPYISDDWVEFEQLVGIMKACGVRHVVSSVADLPLGALEREADYLNTYAYGLADRYRDLYVEKIGSRLHTKIAYRRNAFQTMLDICQRAEMGFGITWEPAPDGSSLAPEYSVNAPAHLQNIFN